MSPPVKKTVQLDKPRPPGEALPYVQPGADPRALGYAAGAQARRTGGLSKSRDPVAGGPPPPIPALEQPHVEGMTMAQQAMRTRGQDSQRLATQAVQEHFASGGIVVPDAWMAQMAGQGAPAAAPQSFQGGITLQPGDMLPDAATKDPQFHAGMGSRVAQTQPAMAMKYGIVRNGKYIPPQALEQPAPGASNIPGQRPRRSVQETTRDMQEAVAALNRTQPAPKKAEEDGPAPPESFPRTDAEAEEQADAGPGGAAKRAGQAPLVEPPDAESVEKTRKMVENLDDFDYERLRREMLHDVLKNPKQKENIEARLKPLDVTELIMHNKVRQRVPILPGKFEPTFESMPGDVELKLKQLLVKESKSIAVTESYLLDKYGVMNTAAGIFAINGNPIPDMYDAQGEFNEEKFWIKYDWVLRRNIHILASLGVNYAWFEQRVRKLFVADVGKVG